MPWWRNSLRISSVPKKIKNIEFKFVDGVVLVGANEIPWTFISQCFERDGLEPENWTPIFSCSKESCGWAVFKRKETTELIRPYWFDGSYRMDYSVLPGSEREEDVLRSSLCVGYGDAMREIWNGYCTGGLNFHASRWNR